LSEKDLYDLAALDAAGALDADARADYERRLARAAPEMRAAIAELYDAAARLATGATEAEMPAPVVRERILGTAALPGQFVSLRASEGKWLPLGVPGITVRVLHVDTRRHTIMLHARVETGAVYPGHHHRGPEVSYVLSGEVIIQGQHFGAGDFHYAAAESDHGPIVCERACEILLIIDAADYVGA
jgi:anti-sigma factor ChrR (cupin superfamily)